MVNETITENTIPLLDPADTIDRALQLMEDNDLQCLPLVEEDKYLALIKEEDLLELSHTDLPLAETSLLQFRPAVAAAAHPYDAVRMLHNTGLQLIPVVDNENTYLGCISQKGLYKYLTEHSGINTPGAIIVLELQPNNYSLYEIARICENEDIIITQVQLSHAKESGRLELTLKTNRNDIRGVVDALERYNYTVVQTFGEADFNENIQNRFDLLMNYLNM
jgi:predicted transcriptional regulator